MDTCLSHPPCIYCLLPIVYTANILDWVNFAICNTADFAVPWKDWSAATLHYTGRPPYIVYNCSNSPDFVFLICSFETSYISGRSDNYINALNFTNYYNLTIGNHLKSIWDIFTSFPCPDTTLVCSKTWNFWSEGSRQVGCLECSERCLPYLFLIDSPLILYLYPNSVCWRQPELLLRSREPIPFVSRSANVDLKTVYPSKGQGSDTGKVSRQCCMMPQWARIWRWSFLQARTRKLLRRSTFSEHPSLAWNFKQAAECIPSSCISKYRGHTSEKKYMCPFIWDDDKLYEK